MVQLFVLRGGEGRRYYALQSDQLLQVNCFSVRLKPWAPSMGTYPGSSLSFSLSLSLFLNICICIPKP